ncbi:MAG: DUF1700 domain-containing protein [Lachnospiraceae bacterium]|nr:DUF1700 domain-containing protein [Lachnospiraceae bacterium]
MTKQKFIERLRSALNGRVSSNAVIENVNYYEDYINTEVRKGRTETEVLQSLGDPRLIARTIIETNGRNEQAEQGTEYQNSGYRNADYQGGGYKEQESQKRFHLPGWLWLIIIILIVVVILSAVMSILSFLAPVIIVFAVVVFLVKLFRDWLN